VTETPNDLRDAIRTALATTPAKHTQGHARPWDTHGTEHRYDATCALCRGEDDTLTDAVVTVVAEHLADARRLTARIHGIAQHPSFAAPADLAQALHEHATQLLAALGTGGGPGGAESDAGGLAGVVAGTSATEATAETQRGAEGVEPISPWAILGIDPDFTGGQSTAEFIAAQRERHAAMLGRAADERTTPPACLDCGMPETNCCCG
jgi:hypothetical protein